MSEDVIVREYFSKIKLKEKQLLEKLFNPAFFKTNYKLELSKLMARRELTRIVCLAEIDNKFAQACYTENFRSRWLNIWADIQCLSVNFVNQEEISPFDLMRGFLLTDLAILAQDKSSNVLSNLSVGLLKKAIGFGSYFAMQHLLEYYYVLIKDHQPFNAYEALELLNNIAKIHRTPGYFLLARFCIHYAYFAQDTRIAKTFCEMAITAWKSGHEIQPYSGAAIRNAYHGQDIKTAEYDYWQVGHHKLAAIKIRVQINEESAQQNGMQQAKTMIAKLAIHPTLKTSSPAVLGQP